MRFLFIAAALVLAGAILWAMGEASILESFGRIVADPWGVVTLVDLYAGFVVAGFVIWRFEPSRPLAVTLIVATMGLGNLVPLIWLAWRGAGYLATGRR